MKEKNIQELAIRMGLISVEDMCQYTIAQLVVKIANKVNELVGEVWRFETDVQEILKTQNENIQYLLGEGLNLEVENIFDGWVQDGTFDTLINQTALKKVNDRIDETNAHLSYKANKNEVFTMANMGQDIKEAMTGGSVAVVGKNTVLAENIVDGQVTLSKLDGGVLRLFGISENVIEMRWKQGSISATNGSNSSGTTRLFTDNYMMAENPITIIINEGFKFKWFQYSEKSTSTYIRSSEWISENRYTFNPDSNSFFRFILAYEDDRDIDVNESNNINIYYNDSSILNNINDLNEEIIELKQSDVLTQESELLMKFPVTYQSGSYAGDMCMVDDLLFCFNITDDEHINFYRGSIYKINVKSKTYELYKRISHNFGHCNTMDYCIDTDTLIFGNGSGTFGQIGKIYIYQGFYNEVLKSNDSTLTFDINNCIEVNGIDDLGEKYNIVWGEDNDGRFDIAYLITNNINNIHRLQLVKDGNLFTGSARVLQTFEYNTGVLPPNNTYCVQGADYHNGYLYIGVGHHKKWYWKFKINADTLTLVDEIKEQSYDENGAESKNQIQGICVNGDYLLLNLNHNVCVYRK